MNYLFLVLLTLFIHACNPNTENKHLFGEAGVEAGDEAGEDIVEEAGEEGGAVAGDEAAGDEAAGDEVAGNEVAGDEVAGDEVAGDEVAGDEAAGDEVAGDEVAGDEAGAEAGTEMPVSEFTLVLIQDISRESSGDGLTGVDICEVNLACDSEVLVNANIDIELGSPICDGTNDAECVCSSEVVETLCSGIDHTDASLVFDGDPSCGNDNWTTLGINGALWMEADLVGCDSIDVNVIELVESEQEGYMVALCLERKETASINFSEDCMVIGEVENGGESSFFWSATN